MFHINFHARFRFSFPLHRSIKAPYSCVSLNQFNRLSCRSCSRHPSKSQPRAKTASCASNARCPLAGTPFSLRDGAISLRGNRCARSTRIWPARFRLLSLGHSQRHPAVRAGTGEVLPGEPENCSQESPPHHATQEDHPLCRRQRTRAFRTQVHAGNQRVPGGFRQQRATASLPKPLSTWCWPISPCPR